MRHFRFVLFLFLPLLFQCSCRPVMTAYPAYTDENRIEVPASCRGIWEHRSHQRGIITVQLLPDGKVSIHEARKNDGIGTPGVGDPVITCSSTFQAQFFRIGSTIYVDLMLLETSGEKHGGMAAALAVVPVHVILRLTTDEDRLTVEYPRFDEPPPLPHLIVDGSVLFHADGQMWQDFLTDSPDKLFSGRNECMMTLERVLVQ